MVNETSDRPRLTPKGARTRARIVEEAAALIHERGVAGTTLYDVKVAAEVSGSQMYHYAQGLSTVSGRRGAPCCRRPQAELSSRMVAIGRGHPAHSPADLRSQGRRPTRGCRGTEPAGWGAARLGP